MEALIKRKGVIKGQMTKFANYIITKGETATYDELSIRLTKTNELYKQFVAVEDQMFVLDNTVESEMDALDDQYFSVVSKTQALIRGKSLNSTIPVKPDDADTTLNISQSNFRSDFKLPRLSLPVFDGNVKQWNSFYDIFISTVHENTNLSPAQKFKYLLGQLRGAAYTAICHFRIDDANYLEALKRLVKKYDRKKGIVETYIRDFLSSPKFNKPSSTNITKLYDTIDETVRGLKALGEQAIQRDPWLILLATEKLDDDSKQLWKYETSEDDYPTIDQFLEFLTKRMNSLIDTVPRRNVITNPAPHARVLHAAEHQPACPLCSNEAHKLFFCTKFRAMPVGPRRDFIAKSNRCFNCLSNEHVITACRNRKCCHKCQRRHNTLLHYNQPTIEHSQPSASGTPPVRDAQANLATSYNNVTKAPDTAGAAVVLCQYRDEATSHNSAEINDTSTKNNIPILPTTRIDIQDKYGNWISCRGLLDSGSTHSFITEGLLRQLKIPRTKSSIVINTLNQSQAGVSRGKSLIKLRSPNDHNYQMDVEVFVLPTISSKLPMGAIDKSLVDVGNNLPLADPEFHVPATVEILLGCEQFFQVLLDGKIDKGINYPCLQNSRFGWLIGGTISNSKLPNLSPSEVNVSTSHFEVAEVLQRIETAIERFWKVEEIIPVKPLTTEEQRCIEVFQTTTKLQGNKIIVQLPFKPDAPGVGESYPQALRRYYSLEKRLDHDENLKAAYHEFLCEYLSLGHMEVIPEAEIFKEHKQLFYLPHHPVVKDSSTTTKVRVVFDASAKSSNGYSLNENLLVGPNIQDNLINLLIRFRKHQYVFSADIEKMFRQIAICGQDKDYHRILWRENPTAKLTHYRLNTVTYGTSPAPFLATASLHFLADKYEKLYPEASKVIKSDLYMDDLMSGSDNLDLALNLQHDIILLMKAGGFNMRKWSANHPRLLENIPNKNREMTSWEITDNNQMISVLGIKYNPISDYFHFRVTLPAMSAKTTKRAFLSETSRIFDPLGLLSPVTISLKILFQSLWLEGINWDDELPPSILNKYLGIRKQLTLLTDLKFPRWLSTNGERVELHGFSDASKDAYAAVMYARVVSNNGDVKTNLIMAKTRVAPIKALTIPKLELNGATLLVRILKLTLESLKLANQPAIYLYTDSTIVLQWMSKPPKILNPFQANRVAEIMSTTNKSQWHFVPSKFNPADKSTRGITPEELFNEEIWFKGPEFLHIHPLLLPASPKIENEENVQVNSNFISVAQNHEVLQELSSKFSNLRKLIHVLAFVLRYKANLQSRKIKRMSDKTLSVDEVLTAEYHIFRFIQSETYTNEINLLLNNKPLPKQSKIFSFFPYVDNHGVLRMRGRLENANITHDAKHPILLPHDHFITERIVRELHYKHFHANHKLLLTMLKQRYAIPRAKNLIRRIIHQCFTCRRFNARPEEQLMGQLPACRVNQSSRPFIEVGIDLAGPFSLKTYKGRGAKSYKAYLVIFICMATKATSLEIVTDMTTDTFIASLKRFSAIRGIPQHIHCDNGTNLVGAKRELQDFYRRFMTEIQQTQIKAWCTDHHIQWHFIPPATPTFGGLWEATVKSCKYHLRRVMGDVLFTYEEFLTIIKQIEALLNSRPLGEIQDDEWSPLTPSHFLIMQPLTMLPEPDIQHLKMSNLSRWQLIQQLMQGFWKQWSQEYVTSLNKHHKWHKENHKYNKGDLVLLRDQNLPPAKWPLARICELHPGDDQLTRVISLKLPNGSVLKRPIYKICSLPKF